MLWGCCVSPSCAAPWTTPAYRMRTILLSRNLNGVGNASPIVQETIKDPVASFQATGGSYVNAQSQGRTGPLDAFEKCIQALMPTSFR